MSPDRPPFNTLRAFVPLATALISSACQAPPETACLGASPPPPSFKVAPLTPGARGQFADAQAAFEAAPNDANANLGLARVLAAYEMYEAADGYLRRGAFLAPQDFRPIYLLGWLRATIGDYEGAVACLDQSLLMQPDNPPARLRRAEALRAMARFDEAEAAYRELLAVYPQQPNVRYGLGGVLLGRGDHDQAIEVLEALTRDFNHFGPAHYALARAYQKKGDAAQATAHLARQRLDPSAQPWFEDPLVDPIKDMNRNQVNLLAMAKKAATAGDWRQAAALLEEAVSEDSQFLVGHVNLVAYYAELGDTARVDEHYRKALALSPQSAELENTHGIALKTRGQRGEARAHFQKAIAADAHHYTSLENLGLLDYEEGKLDAALRDYTRAVEIAPQSQRSWVMIGRIHLRQGRGQEALAAFLRVVRPAPEAGAAVASVREAYLSVGDKAGWLAFARAASEQARRSGLTQALTYLETEQP